ncbi:hypothetical protein BD413DRAFT_575843 [Trametes elegans]|nr:hypothetical protein BD413DRAFT_575843 [Trametes elegans]
MNAIAPGTPSGPSMPHRDPAQVPRSNALLEGTFELAAIFQRHRDALVAEYEQKIHVIAEERDALRAQVSATRGETSKAPQSLSQAELEHTLAAHAFERVRWEQEREQWQREREELRRQRDAAIRDAELKLQVLEKDKDATIAELQTRITWLEEARSAAPSNAVELFDQIQLDSLDLFQSPPHSTIPADMLSTTMGTLTPAKSPSVVPMQVDDGPDTLVDPTPAASGAGPSSQPNNEATAQSPFKSPTIKPRSASSSRSPTLQSLGSSMQPSTSSSTARKLVIRVPPAPKAQKPLIPPPSPITEEEKRTFVHVPRQTISSDEGESEQSSTPSGSPSSSPSSSSAA